MFSFISRFVCFVFSKKDEIIYSDLFFFYQILTKLLLKSRRLWKQQMTFTSVESTTSLMLTGNFFYVDEIAVLIKLMQINTDLEIMNMNVRGVICINVKFGWKWKHYFVNIFNISLFHLNLQSPITYICRVLAHKRDTLNQ